MTLSHPSPDEFEMAGVLHALSDPQRLQIVHVLAERSEPQSCGSFGLDVTKSTASHHFRVLREAGLICQEMCGTSKMTTLRRDELNERFPGLLDAVLCADVPAAA